VDKNQRRGKIAEGQPITQQLAKNLPFLARRSHPRKGEEAILPRCSRPPWISVRALSERRRMGRKVFEPKRRHILLRCGRSRLEPQQAARLAAMLRARATAAQPQLSYLADYLEHLGANARRAGSLVLVATAATRAILPRAGRERSIPASKTRRRQRRTRQSPASQKAMVAISDQVAGRK
jgi:hypothetical protein